MSSKESSLEISDKTVDRDLRANNISGAQDEINDYRKANGNTLSSSDVAGFNKTINDAGFPNLEVVSGAAGSTADQAFIVSKDGAQAEQSIVSALGTNPTSATSVASANEAVSTLAKADAGSSAVLTNDMNYINMMLSAQGLSQFQDSNGTWAIATPESTTGSSTSTAGTSSPEGSTSTAGTSGTGSDAGTGTSSVAPSYSGSDAGAGSTNSTPSDAGLNVNSAAISALGNNPGMQAYATQLLEMLGLPVTAANLQFMEAWQKAEGGGDGASDGDAAYNPFNTTQKESGSTSINSVGVQSYTSLEQGLEATATSLKNGNYGNILSALQSGTSAMADAQAVASSPWGTGSLVEKVLS